MFVEAQQLVVAAWLGLAATLTGLGLLARRAFDRPVATAGDLWLDFWTGLGVLLGLLQAWHLVLPVDDRARFLVAALAAAGWVAAGTAPWRALARGLPARLPVLVAIAVATWWLSNQALAGPRFGDTGLYLTPVLLWIESYPLVPGLANLYVPFGHNISYFLYAAMLDAGPFAQRVYPVVNSVFVLALLARGLVACWRLLRGAFAGRDRPAPVAAAREWFYAGAFVPAMEIAGTLYLTSPMPDTLVFLFGLVLAAELLHVAAPAIRSGDDRRRGAMLRLVYLAGVGTTIKLSLAATALLLALAAFVAWLWRERPSPRRAAGAGALGAVLGLVSAGPWLVRSAIQSGYPFYPATILPLPVDWIARVDAAAWVRKPMELPSLWTVPDQFDWWMKRLTTLGWNEADAWQPMFLLAAGAAALLATAPLRWWRGVPAAAPALLLAAPLAAAFFNFQSTPMVRYQGAVLWVLALYCVVLALAPWRGLAGRAIAAAAVVAIAVAAAHPAQRTGEWWLPLKDFETTSRPRVEPRTLASGLVVNFPANQVCWYAPLPCSPEIHPGLHLREPGNLAAGFAIDPTVEAPTEVP